MVRGAYCIEDVGYTIRETARSPQSTTLAVMEESWTSPPLVIDEPSACRTALSDTVELVSQETEGPEMRVRLRLVRDGRCDLLIKVGSAATDPAATGLSAAITQIRACRSRPCAGPVIAGEIGDALSWRFRPQG